MGFVVARNGKSDYVIWFNSVTQKTVFVDGEIKSRHSANELLKKAGQGKHFSVFLAWPFCLVCG